LLLPFGIDSTSFWQYSLIYWQASVLTVISRAPGVIHYKKFWFTVPIPHWNNGFCQRWSLCSLPLNIRRDIKFSIRMSEKKLVYGCPNIGFNLEPDADKHIRSETFYAKFWGFGFWNKCLVPFDLLEKVAQSFIYYLRKHLFSFFVPFRVYLCIIKDTLLDSFPIRIVRFEPQK